MEHQTHTPEIDEQACRRAALINNLERAFELLDPNDIQAARNLLVIEIDRQIFEMNQPIPHVLNFPKNAH